MNNALRRLFRIQTFLFGLSLLLTSSTVAQEISPPWNYCAPYSADAKQLLSAARDREDPGDASSEKLLSDTRIEYLADGRVKRSLHSIFKVLTRGGVDSLKIDEQWSPWFEKRPVVDARVISRRGIVSRLDPSTIAEAATDRIDDLILSTDKRIQAPLPSITVGSVVEMTTLYEHDKPFCRQGYLTSAGCGDIYGADRWRLQIVAPDSVELNIEQFEIELKPEILKADGKTTWTFTRSAVKPLEEFESYLPSDVSQFPMMRISSGTSWQAFAKHYSEIVEEQIAASELKNPIGKLETDNTKEKIEHILEVMQSRVRYTGLEFGIAAIVPKAPAATWKNGFGDCKDKSVLLVDLLSRVGIDAKVALVSVGRRMDISPTLPAINIFDHAIVFIPKENLWIDPTVEFNPVGMLPTVAQGRWALIADPKTTELIKTPVHESTSNRRVMDWTHEMKEGDPTIVTLKIAAAGNIAEAYRDYYSSDTKKNLKKDFLKNCETSYGAIELIDYDFSDPYDFSQPFELNSKFSGYDNAVVDDSDASFILTPSTVLSRVPSTFFETDDDDPQASEDSKQKTRTSDFQFDTLHQAMVRYKVIAPPGFVIDEIPESSTVEVRDVVFKARFEKESERCCVATFEVNTGKGRFTGEEFEQFKKQLIDVVGDQNATYQYELVFSNQANDLVRAGRYKEAVERLQQDLSENPEEPFLRMQLAYVMLNMGLGKAARIEAKKAVSLRPESAYLQERLAYLFTHDLLGRHFEGEYDFARAESAYQKAIELEPELQKAAINLAVLYEFGPVGVRYQNAEYLAKAIELYEGCHQNDDYRLFDNYLTCLAYAREYKKVLKKLEPMEENSSYDEIHTLALAVVHGVPKAIAYAGRLHDDSDEKADFLSRCAQTANITGEYQTAIQFYEAIAPIRTSQNYDTVIGLLKLLDGDQKEAVAKNDPVYPVKSFLFWAFTDGRRIDRLTDLVELPENEKLTDEFLESEVPVGCKQLRDLGMGQVDRVNRILDLLEFETKSVDRFTLVSVLGKNSPALELYIEKEQLFVEEQADGTFRVVPETQVANKISLRAMELVDSGKQKEALKLVRFLYRERGSNLALLNPMTARSADVIYLLANKKDDQQIKLCAAALGYSDEALAFVKEQLPNQKKAFQLQLLRFIVSAVSYRNEFMETEDVSPYLSQIVDLNPNPVARESYLAALMSEQKFVEAERLLAEYEDKRLSKDLLNYMKIRLLQYHGKFDEASESIDDLLDKDSSERIANLYLWNAMFMEKLPSGIFEFARESVRYAYSDKLTHTYAALLAREQKFSEAKAALGLTVRTRGSEKLVPADSFVLGQIAEGSGLIEIAKTYYLAAVEEGETSSISTTALAKRQLKALAAIPDTSEAKSD